MKYLFPGDPEFTFSEYSSLPYEYVLLSYENGLKRQNRHYHMVEGPTALLSSILANSNRDPKKKREPYKAEDFFMYQTKEDKNIPSSIFGSAAMELVRVNLFPNWGLFAYKDLKTAATGSPPEVLAYISDDALILGPLIEEKEVRGMILAMETAYGQERVMKSPCGKKLKILVPKYHGKIYAEENISIQII